jgi:hypothetical protein
MTSSPSKPAQVAEVIACFRRSKSIQRLATKIHCKVFLDGTIRALNTTLLASVKLGPPLLVWMKLRHMKRAY